MWNNNYSYAKNNIVWVQGIEGAKAYQLSPNTNVQLMDSENEGIFYIKTSDNIGMCNLRMFKYEEVNANPIDTSQFVTRAELENILKELKGERNDRTVQPTKSKQDKSVQANAKTN